MRSIRFSLLLYFLGLLALGLGTASILAYQTANRAWNSARIEKEKQIRLENDKLCQKEERELDEALRLQATAMAGPARERIMQARAEWEKEKDGVQKLFSLGLLSAPLAPNGYTLFHTWVAEANQPSGREWRKNPLYGEIARHFYPRIPFDDESMPLHHGDRPQADYWQIDCRNWSSAHSTSLGQQSLPLDDKVFFVKLEDSNLPSGQGVRRFILRSSTRPFGFPRPFQGSQPPRPAGDNTPRPPVEPIRPDQAMFIQCAFDLSRRDAVRQRYQQRTDEGLAILSLETGATLASFRNRLLLIGSLTFLATLAGSVWLVRAGLSPLHRLSVGVSKISPRNFQLPVAVEHLPGELKPIVQRLKEMLDMLKRAFAREKQANADISHELRTPLAVMLTTTELALKKPRTVDEYREMLTDCQLSAKQMNEIVQRLLTLARLDAGVDQLQRKSIDVVQLADQCATLVRPLAEAQGLTLSMHPSPALPVEGDPDKLREVLNNLLHNAIEYNRPQGRIDLNVIRDQNQVRLEVSDTGIGIGPEARGHIFERFYRADPSRGGDGLHAGLGLALVKEYVDLMGGRIDVESIVGQGSTFRVVLPVVT